MTEADIDKMIEEAKIVAADPKPDLTEMIAAVAGEANRSEGSQRALLLADLRTKPHAETMRHIVLLDAVHSFLTACVTRPEDVAKRLNMKARRQ